MRRIVLFACLALAGAGCGYAPQAPATAIIGPTLIDGSGAPPVDDAVVLIEGSTIRAAGPRAVVPLPASAETVDGRGKFVVPLKFDPARRGQVIRAGSPANLMLLDRNPLADPGSVARPAAVMENGQWIR
jgi:imidazolonepropionase-like amidohydrolase